MEQGGPTGQVHIVKSYEEASYDMTKLGRAHDLETHALL